ncbi:YceI family protein [Parvularcula flava]|uniref:Polyisoprenoid-binding protein n=1 Tax=Aquisalinus luteolus TaxID=1566827 RepID=A0A8J3ERD4_9PROT|nr:YceI family protein [Aquisalinus luteolus]NHK28360.1 YceI family protein [Aquisalinus luteolus]GGH98241.1 polyisoprenoid-binding protein [Aquisalinus luteolus]
MRFAPILLALSLVGCASLADLPGVRDVLTPAVRQEQAALKPGLYRLDPDHASLSFSLDHMGLSTLTGRFDRLEASLNFDEATPEAATLDVLVDMNSLAIATPDFTDTLKGSDWFDVEAAPQARFVSTGISVTGANMGEVTGDLTIGETTAPVTLTVTFNGGAEVPLTGAYTLGFDAEGLLNRSDFGLGRFSSFVSDEVVISFSGEFQRQ